MNNFFVSGECIMDLLYVLIVDISSKYSVFWKHVKYWNMLLKKWTILKIIEFLSWEL